MAAVQIVLVPLPIEASNQLKRYANKRIARSQESKTPSGWPLSQPIPDQRLLDEGRRILAERRERRLMRELESRP